MSDTRTPKVPQWVTTWPGWCGPEFSNQNVTVVPKSDYDALERELAAAKKEAAINAENFHVTNQALVKYDNQRIAAEQRAERAESALLRARQGERERVDKLWCEAIVYIQDGVSGRLTCDVENLLSYVNARKKHALTDGEGA